MATTTNYGWTTPDDTTLVKDGAAAIRSLGTSIDTTTKNLNPSTTLGDLEYRSSTSNTNTRLPIGSSGQVLTVSSGVPAWTTISSGGMTLISETTASAISSLSLSSIPSTYKQLMLVWGGIYHSTTGSQFTIRFNNDSANNYHNQGFNVYNSTNVTSTFTAASSLCCESAGSGPTFGSSTTSTTTYANQSTGYLLIDNYSSTSKWKVITGKYDFYNELVGGQRSISYQGIYASTSAISSIDVFRVAGSATFSNATNTSIRLYGVA